jgi:1-acyl-sn-glycerol-3-phosphate acyltransferase
VVIFALIPPMMLARVLGFYGLSQFIVSLACRANLAIIGLRIGVTGKPMPNAGGIVSNHVSWMDVFVLNAVTCAYFVAKSEVSGWALVGFIARSVGTVFIERRRTAAATQKSVFEDRIALGQRLLFFPEGTSTDGTHVLPFRSSLFAAFFEAPDAYIQPVSIRYTGPKDDPTFYAWFGDMGFAPHFMAVLATRRQGRVDVIFHDPIKVNDTVDRKALSSQAERAVREGFEALADTL